MKMDIGMAVAVGIFSLFSALFANFSFPFTIPVDTVRIEQSTIDKIIRNYYRICTELMSTCTPSSGPEKNVAMLLPR